MNVKIDGESRRTGRFRAGEEFASVIEKARIFPGQKFYVAESKVALMAANPWTMMVRCNIGRLPRNVGRAWPCNCGGICGSDPSKQRHVPRKRE